MQSWGGPNNQLDAYVERIRVQLPEAPAGLLDAYVRWVPWLAIVFGAIGLVFLLLISVIGTALTPFLVLGGSAGVRTGMDIFATVILGIIGSGLDVVGGYLMLQRRLTGWWLVALGIVISALSNLLTFSILGLLISVLVAYVHVSVKPRYS